MLALSAWLLCSRRFEICVRHFQWSLHEHCPTPPVITSWYIIEVYQYACGQSGFVPRDVLLQINVFWKSLSLFLIPCLSFCVISVLYFDLLCHCYHVTYLHFMFLAVMPCQHHSLHSPSPPPPKEPTPPPTPPPPTPKLPQFIRRELHRTFMPEYFPGSDEYVSMRCTTPPPVWTELNCTVD